jgi:hypothetical protein
MSPQLISEPYQNNAAQHHRLTESWAPFVPLYLASKSTLSFSISKICKKLTWVEKKYFKLLSNNHIFLLSTSAIITDHIINNSSFKNNFSHFQI